MSTADFDAREALAWLPEEWARFFASKGERPFRAMQVFRWIHQRGVASADAMTDVNKALRAAIAETGLVMPASLEQLRRADDDTQKGLVRFARDGGTVETVLIPPVPSDDEGDEDDEPVAAAADGERVAPKRVTQCISSQVGCAMACVFCASGVAGLKRNLTAGEIVSQVLLGRAALAPDEALRNVVLMGMGEPLHNYGNVERAVRLLIHRDGINLSSRRVTVSTSGLVPEIDKLGKDFNGHIGLAISLHAPDDALRSELMPINRRYPLGELLASLRRYPLPPRRRITIEYTLLRDVNDGAKEARALAKVLRGIPVKVNLIPMNPVEGAPFRMPDPGRVDAFQSAMRAAGYSTFVRRQRGDDIDAACGQLALKDAAARKRRLPTVGAVNSDVAISSSSSSPASEERPHA